MVHWSCASPLCYNNHATKTPDGEKIVCYRIPPKLLREYCKIFKMDGLKKCGDYICCEHWTNRTKSYYDELPDIIIPPSQMQKHPS